MLRSRRQILMSTLAHAGLAKIREKWRQSIDDYAFKYIRKPEVGMVMAVGRADGSGEPFNLGEVSVSRCAIQLAGGETGIGYVKGRSFDHALHIALLDALSQTHTHKHLIWRQVILPLIQDHQKQLQRQQKKTQQSKVDFFTMVRGETD